VGLKKAHRLAFICKSMGKITSKIRGKIIVAAR
jgi:hypothetical protein